MNAVIRKGQMAGCQNKFKAQLSFKKPTVTGQLIHTIKKKKKGKYDIGNTQTATGQDA